MVTYFEAQKKKEPVVATQAHLLILDQTTDPVARVEEFVKQTLGWPHPFDHPDVHQVNPDLKPIGIEHVRDLQQQIAYQSFGPDGQMFIIFSVDESSIPAQNALLKTLEEPPRGVSIVATAHALSTVLPTIQSRCTIHAITLPLRDSENQDASDSSRQLYQQILQGSWADLITLAETTTDKAEAITTLENLVRTLSADLGSQPTARLTKHISLLQKGIHQLQHNTNVRLTMEATFFAMKKNA